MTAARDVLARLIHDTGCPVALGCVPLDLDYRRADAILSAGWQAAVSPIRPPLQQRPQHEHRWVRRSGGAELACSTCGNMRVPSW